jgi:hypothetical protein
MSIQCHLPSLANSLGHFGSERDLSSASESNAPAANSESLNATLQTPHAPLAENHKTKARDNKTALRSIV